MINAADDDGVEIIPDDANFGVDMSRSSPNSAWNIRFSLTSSFP
jgi:hypothetical protein